MTDTSTLREKIAHAMWRNQAERSGTHNMVMGRTPQAFAEAGDETRREWLGYADAAMAMIDAHQPAPVAVADAAADLSRVSMHLWKGLQPVQVAKDISSLAPPDDLQADLAAHDQRIRREVWEEAAKIIEGIRREQMTDNEGVMPPDFFDEGTSAAYEAVLEAARASKEGQ